MQNEYKTNFSIKNSITYFFEINEEILFQKQIKNSLTRVQLDSPLLTNYS